MPRPPPQTYTIINGCRVHFQELALPCHDTLLLDNFQALEILLKNVITAAAVIRNLFCSQGWLADRCLKLSPVDKGFSPGQMAFRPKVPRKCRWLDSPVHSVQPEALGLVASLFGNISKLWKSRQETL